MSLAFFRHHKLKFFIIACLLGMTAGCASLTTSEPTFVPTTTPTSTWAAPTATQQPTATQTATLTATDTPEPTPVKIPAIEPRCLQIVDEPWPALPGRLVLSGFRYVPSDSQMDQFEHHESLLLDLETGESISLGRIQAETVSPDGNWLAYYDLDDQMVVVMDADGNRELEVPAPDQELEPAYWLDNQRLLLNKYKDNPSSTIDYSLIVLNPFTGEDAEWNPGFPNQNEDRSSPWQIKSNLVFNSTFTRVVYPIESFSRTIILWDVQSESKLAHIYGGSIGNTPRWDHTGARFVTNAVLILSLGEETFTNIDDGLSYDNGTELLLADQTGEIKRLTYLTTSRWVIERNYVWSPDDQHITFLLYEPLNYSPVELAVVNVATGTTTNYCELARLPVVGNSDLVWPSDPVWSLDGKYLAITQIDELFNYTVFLVELESGKAWEIATDVSVMGWMTP